jgi:pimeloyl-ACP methyl ester carboxylesterase
VTRHLVATGRASIDTWVDGHGPSVVVIRSYGRDAGTDFDALSTALVAAGYRVLRPQPRGIAGSTGPMRDVTFAGMAGDVAQVIDDLADGPAVILGHAFGNFVARATAVHRPDLVAAVILAAASGRTVDPQVNSAPMRAGDLTLPEAARLAALRLAPGTPATRCSPSGPMPSRRQLSTTCAS